MKEKYDKKRFTSKWIHYFHVSFYRRTFSENNLHLNTQLTMSFALGLKGLEQWGKIYMQERMTE